MRNQLLEAALRYAGQGRPVFPCESGGKRPRTRNGLHDASTDPKQIELWWRADGNANVGLRTGSVSRLVVLDVDGDEGTVSLRDLERENGQLPRTASVVTPRGGAHFYFRYPGSEIRNSAGQLGPGLDIRGDGGYVLVPPSIGATGRRYEPDERCAPAPLPAWLLDRLRGQTTLSTAPVPASEWIAIVRDGLPEGQRNHGLARLVGHLLARNVDARLVRELAHAVALRCRPPLDSAEVDQVVESIAGAELRKRTARR
jgi:putative DNA primase/helicase